VKQMGPKKKRERGKGGWSISEKDKDIYFHEF
jgi:hypothetical protein